MASDKWRVWSTLTIILLWSWARQHTMFYNFGSAILYFENLSRRAETWLGLHAGVNLTGDSIFKIHHGLKIPDSLIILHCRMFRHQTESYAEILMEIEISKINAKERDIQLLCATQHFQINWLMLLNLWQNHFPSFQEFIEVVAIETRLFIRTLQLLNFKGRAESPRCVLQTRLNARRPISVEKVELTQTISYSLP